jgi:hypothetical protein
MYVRFAAKRLISFNPLLYPDRALAIEPRHSGEASRSRSKSREMSHQCYENLLANTLFK